MKQRRNRLVIIKEKTGQIFRGKGKDVIRVDVLKKMREAAKRKR
jgi:hypothetical protein